jgi:hypothetical protein
MALDLVEDIIEYPDVYWCTYRCKRHSHSIRVVSWRRTSFLCGGAPKKSGWFEHVSRGLNQHNLPQLDTLGLLNYVGMARCHLNMDGSLPENDPGRCNFVPTTPELVEGAN